MAREEADMARTDADVANLQLDAMRVRLAELEAKQTERGLILWPATRLLVAGCRPVSQPDFLGRAFVVEVGLAGVVRAAGFFLLVAGVSLATVAFACAGPADSTAPPSSCVACGEW